MKKFKLIFFIFSLIVCSWPYLGFAQMQEFSADVISSGTAGTHSGKIFSAKDKARMDVGDVITIARSDMGVAWVLMLKENVYMETPLNPSTFVAGGSNLPGETERKLIGKEVIDGKQVDKYRVVSSLGGKKEVIYTWILPSAGIPVKTSAEDGRWQVEYKNINLGRQPESLFELPSGYKKFSAPSMDDLKQSVIKGISDQIKH